MGIITMTNAKLCAGPMDIYVGARIMSIRKAQNASMKEVADAVGISWQQFSKYEAGTNRVSSSRLWQIAAFFDVPISTFFPQPDAGTVSALEDELTGPALAIVMGASALNFADQHMLLKLLTRLAEQDADD